MFLWEVGWRLGWLFVYLFHGTVGSRNEGRMLSIFFSVCGVRSFWLKAIFLRLLGGTSCAGQKQAVVATPLRVAIVCLADNITTSSLFFTCYLQLGSALLCVTSLARPVETLAAVKGPFKGPRGPLKGPRDVR